MNYVRNDEGGGTSWRKLSRTSTYHNNTDFHKIKQLFDFTEMILDQDQEICGMSTMDWNPLPCVRSTSQHRPSFCFIASLEVHHSLDHMSVQHVLETACCATRIFLPCTLSIEDASSITDKPLSMSSMLHEQISKSELPIASRLSHAFSTSAALHDPA